MKSIKIKLEDIKILRCEVRDHPIVFSEEFALENIQIKFEPKFNYLDNFLQNLMHFNFEIEEKGKLISLGHFDIIYTFKVDNLKDLLSDVDTNRILHQNIISVTYSTSRGILFSESKGFAINDIYLTLISQMELYESLLKELSEHHELSTKSDSHDHD